MYSVNFPMKSSSSQHHACVEIKVEDPQTSLSIVCDHVNGSKKACTPLVLPEEQDLISRIQSLKKQAFDNESSKKEAEKTIGLLKRKLEKFCVKIPSQFPANTLQNPGITLGPSTSYSFQERLKKLILETRKIVDPIFIEEPHLLPSSSIKEQETIDPVEFLIPHSTLAYGSSVADTTLPRISSRSPVECFTARGSSCHPQSSAKRESSPVHGSAPCGKTTETLYAEELYHLTRVINTDRSWRVFLAPSVASLSNITNFASLILAATLPPCTENEFSAHLSFIKKFDDATAAIALTAVLISCYSQTAFFSMAKFQLLQYSNPLQIELSPEKDSEIDKMYMSDERHPCKTVSLVQKVRLCFSPRHANQIRKNMLILAEKTARDQELMKLLNKETEESKRSYHYVQKLLDDDSKMISRLHVLGSLITVLATGAILAVRLTQDRTEAQCTTEFTQDLAIYTAIPFIAGMLGTISLAMDASRKRDEIQKVLRPDPSKTHLLPVDHSVN